jgi:hypothetical protein
VRVSLAVLSGFAAVCAAGGCSSAPSPAATASADAAIDSNAGAKSFTIAQHVTAGTDSYHCSYAVASATDTFLVGASHAATAGTHHVLVFRTDLTSLPTGAGNLDCFAGPSSPMRHMRGEVYGSQARTGSFAFPAGVGLPLRGGEVLLVQVHFLDAGAKDIEASVDLTLTTTPHGVFTSAGVFFFDDPFIDIPAGALARATMRCPVPNDVTIVSASSHDHVRARSFAAFLDPPMGAPATLPFYSALDAANPLPLQATIPVAAGSHIRFVCTYQNAGGYQEVLQGLDVQASEMCVFSAAYYPAIDTQTESCAVSPDNFGTGTAACAQTLACVNACPPGTAPPADLGLSTAPNVDACWQRCVVASCPDASALLLALERCTQNHCATECAAPSSGACGACQVAQCPVESSACSTDACAG